MNTRHIATPHVDTWVYRPALAAATRWLAAVAVCCAAAGCQSQSGPSATPGQPGPGSDSSSSSAKPIDACSMISPQDISTLLGMSAPGKPGPGIRGGSSGCTWENTSTEESVVLQLGGPDSAPNNTLRPRAPGMEDMFKPGPDGMLYGSVEGDVIFAAGNRENQVQVAVLRLPPDQRNSSAVDLARKIGPQISG